MEEAGEGRLGLEHDDERAQGESHFLVHPAMFGEARHVFGERALPSPGGVGPFRVEEISQAEHRRPALGEKVGQGRAEGRAARPLPGQDFRQQVGTGVDVGHENRRQRGQPEKTARLPAGIPGAQLGRVGAEGGIGRLDEIAQRFPRRQRGSRSEPRRFREQAIGLAFGSSEGPALDRLPSLAIA